MMCSCGSVVEHCVSSAKGCGFNSQGTHLLIKTKEMYSLNKLWIKASAECMHIKCKINVYCIEWKDIIKYKKQQHSTAGRTICAVIHEGF